MSLIPQKLNLQNGNNIFSINNDNTALQFYNKYELVNATPSNNQTFLFNSGGTSTFTNLITNVNNYYVSNSGSDTSGTGALHAPWLSLTKAINVLNALSGDINAVINVQAGTYTETLLTITKSGINIVGNSNLPNLCVINGNITFNMTQNSSSYSVGGLSNLQINGVIEQDNATIYSNSLVVNNIISVAPTSKNCVITQNLAAGINADMTIQNSILYMCDNSPAIAITSTSVAMVNSQIQNSPLLSVGTQSMIICSGSGRLNLFGCILTQTSTASTVQPIISITNTSNATSSSTISSCTIQYTSSASDAGTGLKCCIRFNNTSSANTYNLINNLFICQGATTTNGIIGQILCVQKASAGAVALSYFGNCAGSTANHFPNAGSGLTKTAFIAVS
jgi:hypothetical protein